MKHICIVGAGRHAQANIYPSLAQFDDVVIDAVCTRHMENSQKTLIRMGSSGRAYEDLDKMLRQETAAHVLVITQADAAVDIVTRCLDQGKHVFCEKPLGMNAAEAQKVLNAAQAHHGDYMVGFMKNYAPVYMKMKELVQNHFLGKACSFQGTMNVDASAFCRTDRDYFYFVGIHYLALTVNLFGMPKSVQAAGGRIGRGSSYHLLLAYENGMTGSLTLENQPAWTREEESLSITFEDGSAESRNLQELHIHQADPEGSDYKQLKECDSVYTVTENPASGYRRDLYLRGFAGELRAYLNGEIPDLQENVKIEELCDTVLKQL